MSPRRTAVLVALVAGAALLVSGCVQIPTAGPVRAAHSGAGTPVGEEIDFTPRRPQPGQSAAEVADGFLQAMLASPLSATVAQEYLTTAAAARWHPEDGYVSYAHRVVGGTAQQPRVTLTGVNRFDSRGAWTGAPADGRLVVDLPVEPTVAGFRITAAPDVLLVSDDWFEQQTQPLSIYFFSPSARTLVPEPVFVPQGEQRPTLLVRALLEGPVDGRVDRTFVPSGTRLNLSVTVRADGVAEVPLTGDLGAALTPAVLKPIAVQLAWTLRQVAGITAVEITLDGRPLAVDGSRSIFDVDTGADYDPVGIYAGGQLFGIRRGVAVRVLGGSVGSLPGPFGQRPYGLRDVAVDLDASLIAGVADDGRQVLQSTVAGPVGVRPRVVLRGTDLLRPAWDTGGRLWMVDRTSAGARVWVVSDPDGAAGSVSAAAREVNVPGVTGQRVVDFLVSRDGTRLVAAVRGARSDRIVQSRLYPGAGTPSEPRATAARVIVSGPRERLRIRDLGWRDATSLYYLRELSGDHLELRSSIVDGSPERFDPSAIPGSFPATDRRIVSSPRNSEAVYIGSDGHWRQTGSSADPVPAGVDALTYAG